MAVKTALAFSLSLLLFAQISKAGTNGNSKPSKDCCFMEKGVMMCCMNGMVSKMDTAMTMKNGTRCMVNGKCVMADGRSIMLKEGQCCDMMGNVDYCLKKMVIKKKTKTTVTRKSSKTTSSTATYFCPIHQEVTSGEEGHCGQCGMALVQELPMKTILVDVD